MLTERPRILLACNRQVRDRYIDPAEVARLETFADWDWFACEGGGLYGANTDPDVAQALQQRCRGLVGERVGQSDKRRMFGVHSFLGSSSQAARRGLFALRSGWNTAKKTFSSSVAMLFPALDCISPAVAEHGRSPVKSVGR